MPPSSADAVSVVRSRLVAHWRGQGRAEHTLVRGGFGLGKSYVLDRAVEGARREFHRDEARLAFIRVGAGAVSTYADLLYEVVRALIGTLDLPAVDRAARLRAAGEFAALEQLVRADKKSPLVVVLDDLDLAVRNFSAPDVVALEAFVARRPREDGVPLLLASSSDRVQIGGIWSTVKLQPLEQDEAIELIAASRPPGVTPYHSFAELFAAQRDGDEDLDAGTLGNPRFWTLVASYLDGDAGFAIARALKVWREMLSLHYPERLASLAPTERRIVVELARASRPATVSELAAAVGMTNPSAASALGRMLAAGWVRRVEAAAGADRRSTWYELADPLVRLFLQRREATGASSFVVSAARAWERATATAPEPPAIVSLTERMAKAEDAGNAANEIMARDMLRQIVVDAVQTVGLSAPVTVQAMGEWGRWAGETGDRQEAVRILRLAVKDSEAVLGHFAEETLMIMSHLSWDLIQVGDYPGAGTVIKDVKDRAEGRGPSGRRRWVDSRQNEAIVVGGLGDPDGAVAIFEEVLEIQKVEDPDDLGAQRRCRHGMAWWMAQARRWDDAIALYDQLLTEDLGSEAERLGLLVNRIYAMRLKAQEDPAALDDVIDRYLELAEVADQTAGDSRVESTARKEALDLATRLRPAEEWPLEQVQPGDFSKIITALITARTLRSDLDAVLASASEPQLARLATDAIFGNPELNVDERIRLATLIGERTDAAYGPLLLGFVGALRGEGAALSALPTEWVGIVSAMRD